MNLNDAYRLYKTLSPHTPRENIDEVDSLSFMQEIVHHCTDTGRHVDFVDSLKILTGLTTVELGKIEGMNLVEIFFEGLIANNFITLIIFFDELGVKHD